MYHACRVTLIPEDFRSPSFLFFFSFLSLDFLSDYWLPFPFSRHISMFFVEWNSVQWEKKEKKLAKSDFDVSRKILCFWLVELDEITRNHGSPTSFGTVRIVQIWQAYTHTWKNVTLVEEWCFDFVNINVNQFGIIILIHILIKIIV